ncbi:hypothetical protein LTR62_004494 [Meristemomyces frigidus]|uniref:Uncharacterized protein n=1 Tax=Meristemomyces frigidus TaxID=1508187 RepID=A0AAN7THF3_9PEZI|nr:hypothetical protein LTR62_004494 [Meristemomyces frigidus]
MASRTYANAGVLMAALFGIFTAYTAFQPELSREAEEKATGTFKEVHTTPAANAAHVKDNAISEAILSDLREAKREVTGVGGERKGALWGVREATWGRPKVGVDDGKSGTSAVPAAKAVDEVARNV